MQRILVISHTYIVDVNREKIEELAKILDIKVGLAIPFQWSDLLQSSKAEESDNTNHRIFVVPIFFNGNIAKFFFSPLKLFKAFWEFKPDIVQIEEEPWSLSLLECLILAKIFRAKALFFTWQNIYSQYSHFSNLVEAINLRLVDAAIAGNNEAKEILRKRGFEKPIEVIPQLGVNPQTFYPSSQPYQSQVITIGYIGRFVEEKGVPDLLEAFKGLEGSVRLKLVGRGLLEGQIKKYIKDQGLDGRVEIIPAVPHNQVPPFMARVDIFVLPSKTTPFWKEQFGHVLIEAMACKVAVVGSSSGAIAEVIGKSGLIFQEGNINDLKEKLQGLVDNKDYRFELAQRGYQRVLENFTNNKIAHKTIGYYRNLFKFL